MRAHRLQLFGPMREQDDTENEPKEKRTESTSQSEPPKRDPKKRVTDTLTDENPLIFRGLD